MPEWVRDAMADESGAAGAGGRRGSAAARPPYAASKPPAATAAETAKERAAISQGKGAAPSRRAKGWNDTDAEEDEEDDEDEGARRRGRATTRVPARGSAEEAAAVERMAEESRAEQAHMHMHVGRTSLPLGTRMSTDFRFCCAGVPAVAGVCHHLCGDGGCGNGY